MLKKNYSLVFFFCLYNILFSQNLKVITINVWSGLNYIGNFKMGEYEELAQREKRFQLFLAQLKNLDADIIFLQEANPIKSYSSRLAKALGMEQVHQVCNAGIKIASIGFPINMSEGITILAKQKYNLTKTDVWKLSGSFGVYGDFLSIHFDESNFALVAKIVLNGMPVYLINVHTSSTPPMNDALLEILKELLNRNEISTDEYDTALGYWKDRLNKRSEEFETLNEKITELPEGIPFIIGGDFNIEPEDSVMRNLVVQNNLLDTYWHTSSTEFTWEPLRNININFSTIPYDAERNGLGAYDIISCQYDLSSRRIDYLFLSRLFDKDEVKVYKIVLDSLESEVQASDHFGVYSEIDLTRISRKVKKEEETFKSINYSSIEPFPILMYDTDIGFGYGAKAFFLNLFDQDESIDLTAFNSTKGERWYRFAFSWPDVELRQGKVYPLAIDFIFDYDKMIKNGFYGVGRNSKYSHQEFYTKEPLEFNLSASRGFTTNFVGQLGLRAKAVSNYNFDISGKLKDLVKIKTDSIATFLSAFLNLRYDSRNSFINPTSGVVIQGEVELAGKILDSVNLGSTFFRYWLGYQYYTVLFYPKTILAVRFQVQNIVADNLPIQLMYSLGGNRTLRGYPQDRIMDKCTLLFNGELRFPIYKRFTGILGLDAGQVFPSISEIDLNDWKMNPVIGLRFNMENFVVRLDAGFSSETTGLYFNFGHIF